MNSCKNTKFIIVLLIALLSLNSACKSNQKVSDAAKEYEKAELLAEKETEDEYLRAIKYHQAMQSKQTKESAKLLKKQQKKINKSKKRSFWDRLFNNKCDRPVD
jgi:hypothetical protein